MPTYTVERGDTVWALTRRALQAQLGRRPTNAEIQAVVNRVSVPSGNRNLIRPGERVTIPVGRGYGGQVPTGRSERAQAERYAAQARQGGGRGNSRPAERRRRGAGAGSLAGAAAAGAVAGAAGGYAAGKRGSKSGKPKGSRPRVAAKNAREAIANAKTMNDLNSIARRIKISNISESEKAKLRDAWAKKRDAIKPQGEAPVPPIPDEAKKEAAAKKSTSKKPRAKKTGSSAAKGGAKAAAKKGAKKATMSTAAKTAAKAAAKGGTAGKAAAAGVLVAGAVAGKVGKKATAAAAKKAGTKAATTTAKKAAKKTTKKATSGATARARKSTAAARTGGKAFKDPRGN